LPATASGSRIVWPATMRPDPALRIVALASSAKE